MRASSEITPRAAGAASRATDCSCAGLWASTMTSARSASSRFEASASPPSSAASLAARPDPESVHSTGSPHPRASARAMFPAPMNPTCMAPDVISGLVEEALFDQAGALLRGDLDVARREQEHLVGDPLHAAVERVGEARREVDQALGEVRVGPLEIDDHGDRVLEFVRHVLGVVEGLGDHEMHAD